MNDLELLNEETIDEVEVVIPEEFYAPVGDNVVRKPSSLRTMNNAHQAAFKLSNNPEDKLSSRNNSFAINKSLIRLTPGFNIRVKLSESHIQDLVYSYKNGIYVPPIIVKVVEIEGKMVAEVKDGHHRFLAMMRVAEIDLIEVIEFKGNDVDDIFLMLTSANTQQLTPMDRGQAYRRLEILGVSRSLIAQKLGKSAAHISQCLALASMPFKLQQLVADGVIAATLARDLHKEFGDKVMDHLENQGLLDTAPANKPVVDAGADANTDTIDTDGVASGPEEGSAPKEQALPLKKITKKRLTATVKAPKLAKEDLTTMCDIMESLAKKFSVDDVADKQEVTVVLTRDEALRVQQLGAELEALKAELEKQNAALAEAKAKELEAQEQSEKQEQMDI
ncbi:hypothetical protein OCF84_21800 (plasmid) [Shewanella xiamenensis]|uniref:ParB/Spo0J HTH domain-containing protein n=1 Tax=Shewanella xiamenensis TaxID=332186 RepID=A0ABT6UDM5_9GAMM|nr:hypothetical protein [Shewanella xiamenensis]MDI5832486.1 hypothetical protein [Shewanella xiamenensis]WHF57895.1 hypothetical protein OCF84_21800 [Shewanella xiamenensis]